MTTFNPNELLIWWVNSLEVSQLLSLIRDPNVERINIPSYIVDELHSIDGRPLRGRLWASPRLAAAQAVDMSLVFVNKAGSDFAVLAGERGGIIIEPADAQYCRRAGFITNQQLELQLPSEVRHPRSAAGMLPEALVPHADEWYRVIERRFAVDKIKISGPLLCAIVEAISSRE